MEINKKQLRKEMRNVRNALKPFEIRDKSRKIFERICTHTMYYSSKYIFSYASFRNEVDTREFNEKILEDGKILLMPKVLTKEEMQFFVVTDLDQLQAGYMGVLEPSDECQMFIPSDENSLMILPGLAYDLKLNRMGYGGGYYDRYLEHHTSRFIRCGVAYNCQIVENVPIMDYDQSMDYVVTEEKLIERMNHNDA